MVAEMLSWYVPWESTKDRVAGVKYYLDYQYHNEFSAKQQSNALTIVFLLHPDHVQSAKVVEGRRPGVFSVINCGKSRQV